MNSRNHAEEKIISRAEYRDALKKLDPARDDHRIVQLFHEHHPDSATANGIQIFTQFAVRRITEKLVAAGGFIEDPGTRLRQTSSYAGTIGRYGYQSEEGKTVLGGIRATHERWGVTPAMHRDGLAFVSLTFVHGVDRFLEKFGARPLLPEERQGLLHFWNGVAGVLGVEDMPTDFSASRQFYRQFEEDNIGYAETNRQVADPVMRVIVDRSHRVVRPFMRMLLCSVMEKNVVEALGFPEVSPFLRSTVLAAAKARSLLYRIFR